LLESDVQLPSGPHQGGVVGWLGPDGRPEFVYLEITGYFLTAMAWTASGAARSEQRRELAVERGNRALDWARSAIAGDALPPTRLYLSEETRDWRNAATFTFDLAMAARGVACFNALSPMNKGVTLLQDLAAQLEKIGAHADVLPSHALRGATDSRMPDRWSTRAGPHHIKAAAALIRLPVRVLEDECRNTVAHWEAALLAGWPCRDLHPLCYGLEGLLVAEASLDAVEQIYRRLLELQAADGSLPATVDRPGAVRSDVLAQALRVGCLLRADGRLRDDDWTARLDALAGALLRHVREDGGVLFATNQGTANTWCAMFTYQALLLYSRAQSDALDGREAAHLI
jgi:hypothetical protein